MTVHPRDLADDLEYEGWGDSADLMHSIVVPLYDAWLKANPPCPTCGGEKTVFIDVPWQGHHVDHCPDCIDRPGVLPFDRWTAGLVAVWTAVHKEHASLVEIRDSRHGLTEWGRARLDLTEDLRQIGGIP